MDYVNSTTTYLGSASMGLASWLPMCIALMYLIFFVSFLIYKTFRWSLIGAGISGVGFFVFKFTEWISKQNASGNSVPLEWFGYVAVFVAASVIIGQVLKMSSCGKKFDAWLEENNVEYQKQLKKDGKKKEKEIYY